MISILSKIGEFVINLAKIDSRFNRFKHIGLFLMSFAASVDGAATKNKYMILVGFALALATHMRKAFGRRQRLFRNAPPLGVQIHKTDTPDATEAPTKPYGPRDKG